MKFENLAMSGRYACFAIGFLLVGLIVGFSVSRPSAAPATVEKRDEKGRLLPHYDNNVRAESLAPGQALSQVIEALGDPVGFSGGWFLFLPSPNGRMIRVEIDSSGLVQAVDPSLH